MLFFICLLFKLLLITGESIYFTSLSGFKMFPIKQTLEHRLPSFDPPQHFYDVFKTKLQFIKKLRTFFEKVCLLVLRLGCETGEPLP